MKKIFMAQLLIICITLGLFFSTFALNTRLNDYNLDRIKARYLRMGGAKMYGYTFIDWNLLMTTMSEQTRADYINLVKQGLDFAFVQVQWSIVGKARNDTLDQNYLGNLTRYIEELAKSGLQVVIHTWVSSYSPAWMFEYCPELKGQKDRWQGIDPNTTNQTLLEHRRTLLYSNIHFHEQLCAYFQSKGIMNYIHGWCLDDETQSDNWAEFFQEITKVLLTYNSSWQIGAMFNNYDKYHLTGDTGMTCNYMDPYDPDPKFINKINYAFLNSGVENISVLISGMGPHDDPGYHDKIRRQTWIAWFMGANSIGWYPFLYPDEKWSVVKWNDGQGPIKTGKTEAALQAKIDIHKLNDAYRKIFKESNTGLKTEWTNKLLLSYSHAKINRFDTARQLVQEVLDA